MRAVLFSLGTRGDIEPFLAIAQLLRSKDWEVVCVFPEQFRGVVEGIGLTFRGFSSEFLEILEGQEARKFMGGRGSVFQRFGYVWKMGQKSIKVSAEMVAFQHKIQEELNPDRVIYHPKCLHSLLWGQAHPGKSMMLSPIPGVAHPMRHINIFGDWGKTFNLMMAHVSNIAKTIMIKRFSKKFTRDYPDMKFTFSGIRKVMLQQETTLYAISPTLFPKPSYWPTCARVVGYHERDKTLNWQPDSGLLSFLERHDKVVFITFGSMTNANPKEKTRIILDILQKHRIPAIINTSWGGLVRPDIDVDYIHFVSNIPYDWIFQRVYAVVHHGGSGSTHTSLKYGCPCLIVPHIIDQFMWRIIVSKKQLGPYGASIKKLNHHNFEKHLLDLLHNERYRENAQQISKEMRAEHDPDKLYELILQNPVLHAQK